jgi:nucleoside phosphorylase
MDLKGFCFTGNHDEHSLLSCSVILCFIPMQLIAAALEEELKTGLILCGEMRRIHRKGINLWQAVRGDKTIQFLRTGVGPRRAAESLEKTLMMTTPSEILVIGYAGALDPRLKLGNLVAVETAMALSLDESHPDWEHARLGGAFELANCEALARSAKHNGLTAYIGDALTSSHVLGAPEHKRLLYEKFQASIVDMETAALASVAACRAIPLSCIRVVSDEAQERFLEPFSHNPSIHISARAKKLLDTGMIKTYREWKDHASLARVSLSRFLSHYL